MNISNRSCSFSYSNVFLQLTDYYLLFSRLPPISIFSTVSFFSEIFITFNQFHHRVMKSVHVPPVTWKIMQSGQAHWRIFLQFILTTEETTPQHDHCIKRYPYMVGNSRDHRSRVKHLREVLPHFKGHWIPRLNDNPTGDLHCAMLLLLLKPWHTLQNLHVHSDWSQEFAEFMISAHSTSMWIALNFQFFHVAHDALVESGKHTIL